MARIDIKALKRLQTKLEAAAIAFAEADAKAIRKGSAAFKSLAIATRNDAFEAMQAAAIDLVCGLLIADDLKGQAVDRSALIVKAITMIKKRPYAVIFEAAGAKE